MSLRQAIANPSGKSRYVRRLFATIADRYDLITVLLSYGRDRSWKRRLTRMAGPLGGVRALDLACGTGAIAMALADGGAIVPPPGPPSTSSSATCVRSPSRADDAIWSRRGTA